MRLIFSEVDLPGKLDPYKSYGTKLVSLFARLMFSQENHSLTELARLLKCSKQTVLRLVDDIRRAYGVEIEETFREKQKYYRLKKKAVTPSLSLTATEATVLHMCKAFTEHLLGPALLKDASQGIEKSMGRIGSFSGMPSDYFAALPFGAIDYTIHQETLRTLIRAMEERIICSVTYRAGHDGRVKAFFIKPLKLFSHRDCLYLSSQMARYPGRVHKAPDFDPLLAVHRIAGIQLTDRRFEVPRTYRFEERFKRDFGVIKEQPIPVEVEFTGWAAAYASERVWSRDQRLSKQPDGTARLRFKASSEAELLSWVLSFRGHCRLRKPASLFKELKKIVCIIDRMHTVAGAKPARSAKCLRKSARISTHVARRNNFQN
jgi:predicted DNA-binding transcriptional regulator YafY